MIAKKILSLVIIGLVLLSVMGCSLTSTMYKNTDQWLLDKGLKIEEFNAVESIEDGESNKSKPFKYKENDGIFVFYETDKVKLYRELLPETFQMPETPTVHLFVMDFYDIDSEADPYKEMAISLLGKYDDEEVWHCIYMPVTSEQSMIAGRVGLGLPKSLGSITFERLNETFIGTVTDNMGSTGQIELKTKEYVMSQAEKDEIKSFMSLPKLNFLNGELVQMTRAGGEVNIIDVWEKYPKFVDIIGGKVELTLEGSSDDSVLHPFDLQPSNIIAAYYLHNRIPFSLDRK